MLRINARILAAFCCLLLATGSAKADIVLDMDISTLGIVEPVVFVSSGTTITIRAFYLPIGPLPTFDAVGLDLSGAFPGDTATAVPTSGPPFTKAGPLASMGTPGFSTDYLTGGPVITGSPLMAVGLPTPFPPALNIGGAGYSDPGLSLFGGAGLMPAFPINLMGWEFTVTGSTGDFMTFHPSGVFTPGFYGIGTKPTPGTVPPLPGGAQFYNSLTGFTSFQATPPPGTFMVFIIPEPTGGMLAAMMLTTCALSRGRRKRSPLN